MVTTVTGANLENPFLQGFFVKFWGTRGSIPTPGFRTRKYGGNTSCVEVRIDGTLFICDGGTGLRELGTALMRRHPVAIEAHLLFSHPHWDHIQGFPFFTPAYAKENTLRIYGTKKGDRRIFELLSGQMRSDYFPVSFSELSANIVPSSLEECGGVINGVEIQAFEQHHPGMSYAFSFEKRGKKVVYATDNEVDQTLLGEDEGSEALRRVPEPYLDFVRGADLLIADGQYTDEEYPDRAGWGHARATTLVDAAVQAGVKQLAIYHHDPMHADEQVDALIERCRQRAARHKSPLIVFGAREGLELRIDAE